MKLADSLVQVTNEALMPRFRTKIEELLPKIPEKGSGQQIAAMLKNNGVTDDEIRWTKIGSLLQQPKVTKAEIVDHLKQHGLPFTVTDHAETYGKKYQDYTLKGGRNYGEKIFHTKRTDMKPGEQLEWDKTKPDAFNVVVQWYGYKPGADRSGRYNPPDRPYADVYAEKSEEADGPKQYLKIIGRVRDEGENHPTEVFSETCALDDPDRDSILEKAKEDCEKAWRNANAMNAEDGDNYKSNHWPGANPLFHIRHQEFTDADGKELWLIEEIQSDWHQAGRKRGYRPPAADMNKLNPEFKMKNEGGKFFVQYDPAGDGSQMWHGPYPNEAKAIHVTWAEQRNKSASGFVPDAPMKKSWEEMAFKWALHQAVEANADRIGWVTGDISAERYDLSKQVGEIVYREKYGELRAFKPPHAHASHVEGANGGLAFERSQVKPDELENFIGKEMAKKLLDQPEDSDGRRRLRGLELKVGGEGMKAAYDQRIPSIAKKIAKATGAMMGKVKLPEAESRTVESRGPPQVDGEAMQKAARMIRDQHNGVSWDSQGTPELGDEEAQEKYESDGEKFDDLVEKLCVALETGDPNKIPKIGEILAEMDDLESEWNDTPATDRAGEIITRRIGWSDWAMDFNSSDLFHHMQQYEHREGKNGGAGPEVWYLELNNKVRDLVAGGMRATFESVKPKASKPWWVV